MNKLTLSFFTLLFCLGFSVNINAQPFYASLECAGDFQSGLLCAASPDGQSNYAWSTTGAAIITPSCFGGNSDHCHAACQGQGNASVSVTITDANGFSDIDTQEFWCDDENQGGF